MFSKDDLIGLFAQAVDLTPYHIANKLPDRFLDPSQVLCFFPFTAYFYSYV